MIDFFEKLFHGTFIDPQSFCQKSVERNSPKKYLFFSYFVLMSDLGFASNKPTHYLPDYGDCIGGPLDLGKEDNPFSTIHCTF